MIHRIFQWRARKKLARTRYRLDRRHYHGEFRAGFLSHLHNANFWENDRDPSVRRLRWRRRGLWAVGIAILLFLGWLVWESIRALSIF